MKILLFLSAMLSTYLTQAKCHYINAAKNNGQVSISYTFYNGPFSKSMLASINNPLLDSVCIVSPAGMLLESSEPRYQNHVVIAEDSFYVKKQSQANHRLAVKCCEHQDSYPAPGTAFRIITNSNKHLVDVCRLIDSLNVFGYEAQRAIWAICDSTTPNAITGADSNSVMQLRYYVGKINAMPISIYKPEVYITKRRQAPNMPFNNDGTLMIDNVNTYDNFTLELYDADSDLKINSIAHTKMLIQRKTLSLFLGNIKLNNLQSNNSYVVRLSKNGVIVQEWLYQIS